MAVSFPLNGLFTRYGIKTTRFFPEERQSFSRNGAGAKIVVDYRMPIWKASYVSAAMSEDDCLELEAELSSLRGAANIFHGIDTRRLFPRLGPQTVSAYSSAQVSSVNLSANSVAFSGLPANLALSRGDKFSVLISGSRYLYAIAEPITANALGATAQVEVVPQLHPLISAGAATLASPTCAMRLVPGSVQFNPSGNLLATVSFEAEQI